jgi:hypothetical protein
MCSACRLGFEENEDKYEDDPEDFTKKKWSENIVF